MRHFAIILLALGTLSMCLDAKAQAINGSVESATNETTVAFTEDLTLGGSLTIDDQTITSVKTNLVAADIDDFDSEVEGTVFPSLTLEGSDGTNLLARHSFLNGTNYFALNMSGVSFTNYYPVLTEAP